MRDAMPRIGAFVALGDSFTEGLGDPYPDGTGYRGWADRFAERLAADHPGLRYANLAVRGRLLREVADDQVPRAVAMAPDLVSLAAGGNDLLRPRADPDALAQVFDDAVVRLAPAGGNGLPVRPQVLVFTGFDPRTFPLIRLIRGKAAAYNMHLRAIADHRGCLLVDLWSMRALADPRAWSPDRLHLAPDGHRRVALRASEVVGLPVDEDWREPFPGAAPLAAPSRVPVLSRYPAWSRAAVWLAARRVDARWAREHAAPWAGRRLRGASTGDGVPPKRPDLLPLLPL